MPTATATLATLGQVIIDTGVSIATTIFTDYWPYILVFGVLLSLAIWIKRVVGLGKR
jgi:hypothetical protein